MNDLKQVIGNLLSQDPSVQSIVGSNIYYARAPQNISVNSFIVYFINTTGAQKDLSGDVLWRIKTTTIFVNSYTLDGIYLLLDRIYNLIEDNIWYVDLVVDDRPFFDEDNKWFSISVTVSVQDFFDNNINS
jgi:hypothetical protein